MNRLIQEVQQLEREEATRQQLAEARRQYSLLHEDLLRRCRQAQQPAVPLEPSMEAEELPISTSRGFRLWRRAPSSLHLPRPHDTASHPAARLTRRNTETRRVSSISSLARRRVVDDPPTASILRVDSTRHDANDRLAQAVLRLDQARHRSRRSVTEEARHRAAIQDSSDHVADPAQSPLPHHHRDNTNQAARRVRAQRLLGVGFTVSQERPTRMGRPTLHRSDEGSSRSLNATPPSTDPSLLVQCPSVEDKQHDHLAGNGGGVCIICQENAPLCAAVPCMHMSYCVSCARSLCCTNTNGEQKRRGDVACAKCRVPVQAISRVFLE